jgi:hypothetical protein
MATITAWVRICWGASPKSYRAVYPAVTAVATDNRTANTLPTVVSISRICAHRSRDQAQLAGMRRRVA